jgi:leucyl-tRNA synthetase
MEFINSVEEISLKDFKDFLKILSPFAPHLSEELYQSDKSIFQDKWPEYNPKLIIEDKINLVVQINGKVRDTIVTPKNITEKEATKLAMESGKVEKWIKDRKILKTIFIKDKLINFVI